MLNEVLRMEQEKSLSGQRAKMRMWRQHGAALAGLMDPERRIVEIPCPGEDAEVVEDASALYREEPVAGVVLELARLWN